MDIVVLAVTVIAALLLTRTKALAVAGAAWTFGLAMVAWGPANNSSVHLDRASFWGPWAIVLLLCLAIVFGVDRYKRRGGSPGAQQRPAG